MNASEKRAKAAKEVAEKMLAEETRHETAMACLAEELDDNTALIYINDKPQKVYSEEKIGGCKPKQIQRVVKVLVVGDLR